MKVSVLMPVYRTEERHLRAAIESVLAQTMGDFEFLVLDDCPEDDREAVVRSYRDPRLVYVKNDRNLGISASRNRLMEMAKGEYLAVFDHDDICHPERFAKEAAYLVAHPECGVVGSWLRQTSNGSVTHYPEDDHDIKIDMMREASIWHPAAMIRRAVIERGNIRYREDYSPVEDYMLWMELVPVTRFHNLPEPLLDYRRHERNTSVVRKAELERAEAGCRAWAKTHLAEWYAEYELRRETVTRVRILGVQMLKIVSSERGRRVYLFGHLPILSVVRRVTV